MELKSLILGLALSLGAFAVKAGAGLGYAMANSKATPPAFLIPAGFVAGYGLAFFLAAQVLDLADLTAWYPRMEALFKSGMVVHLVLAGLLAAWGYGLLIQTPGQARASRAWLALALPCPVCFLVILLNTGLLSALYPDQPKLVWWLFAGFTTACLAVALVFYLSGRREGQTTALLGGVMLYMAAYFFLCALVVPGFGGIETVYRLCTPLSDTPSSAGNIPAALLGAGAVLALAAGFFNPFEKRD